MGFEPTASTLRKYGSQPFDQVLSEDFPGSGVSIMTITFLGDRQDIIDPDAAVTAARQATEPVNSNKRNHPQPALLVWDTPMPTAVPFEPSQQMGVDKEMATARRCHSRRSHTGGRAGMSRALTEHCPRIDRWASMERSERRRQGPDKLRLTGS